ncbi:MAG: hypothetical protein ACTHMS_04075 [Jatrophihabitans sp.]|uniref:hypothetical protein n=1 Tax=Jatrophihabitans sp. TaxID=1932789 RepID=UPI003F7DAB1C
MITKFIAGGVAAAAVGITGATLTASATPSTTPGTPSGAPKASASAKHHHGDVLKRLARRAVHGQVVTENKQGQFVTHTFDRGTVAAVSASSIEVHTADGTTQTFTVTSATHVRRQGSGKTTISTVKSGDKVVVTGVGTGTPTARLVFELRS